ncbi:protein amalgam-like isoform X2 [Dreissena polymorpha]|uniref:Ig-like domain-containing protein n=1 Tax=Dreissena polymorpha TaxID=45954 RepID=A0A9D4KK68_DREPO|nr:protein amalgam-like isoform X2 [Dreissena polymorpha]KAH3841372.1 hypothetical protein DPMN_114831 [Dreissena polymorpha]
MTGEILGLLFCLTNVLSLQFEPLFNDDVTEVKVVAGSTALLPCYVLNKGEHTIIWMNPKRILFSNEQQIVIDDKRVGIVVSGSGDWNLRIEHARYNDSGEYSCLLNTKPVKIKRVFLFVQVPAHILNQESSRDIEVEEGNNVTLRCRATGVPQPNITWFRRPFVSMENKEYLSTEGEMLTVHDVRRYQAGVYVCLAYNGVPPAVTREMQVNVQYIPVVKLLNTRLGQILGRETILECSVTSYPRAKITWLKHGIPIQHSYKYRMELYPGKHDTHTLTMTIYTINERDFGEYTCEATNRMGTKRETMTLYEYIEPTPTTPTTRPPKSWARSSTGYQEEYYEQYAPNIRQKPFGSNPVPLDRASSLDKKAYATGVLLKRKGYYQDGGVENSVNDNRYGRLLILLTVSSMLL